ncbi:uncharacterized protein MONBRDRAFT_22769 [Monosiga brevicollis MX1]|uniref:t-SNARE coiled-coil homology domain-containing protein n=1 Tax=Monosiga brevicollis TaxID=81824 RepID=A9US12_MONBE|nr:uncharacterized protein MONBRDRAFT_22769 [Monosiga brevicollis MX1]EDQ91699.1 predicted protein [Monosiga brevicollis MX1]|eukprot:XP_001742985.1 hypothetical protein [Monosiga brevicollis MX1]
MKKARALYQRWQQLFGDRSTDSEELEWTTKELRTSLKGIDWDLEDLAETVVIAEKEPEKFKLSHTELAARRQFIERSRRDVQEMVDGTNPAKIKAKRDASDKANLMGGSKYNRYEKLEREIQEDNQNFIDDQHQTQGMIMREQDTQLQEVGQTIGVLRQMGQMIGDELEDQNELLEDLDTEMTTTGDRLTNVLRKLDRTLSITKASPQIFVSNNIMSAQPPSGYPQYANDPSGNPPYVLHNGQYYYAQPQQQPGQPQHAQHHHGDATKGSGGFCAGLFTALAVCCCCDIIF